jgi:hypothetical protein
MYLLLQIIVEFAQIPASDGYERRRAAVAALAGVFLHVEHARELTK